VWLDLFRDTGKAKNSIAKVLPTRSKQRGIPKKTNAALSRPAGKDAFLLQIATSKTRW